MSDEVGASPREVPEHLSYTSRPALMTAVVLSLVLLSFAMYGWYAIGKEIRDQITWIQAATLLFFMFFMIGVMLSVGYSRLWANADGVTVRNGPILRRYPIDQIAGVRLRKGDAWSSLLIKGGEGLKRKPALAIQSLEGEEGQRKLVELRRWLVEHGATSRDVTLRPEDEPPQQDDVD
ncbi:PH domain-containing protein [Tessaracoccus bendigoensis DSM 12906]|uniref:PH domain-containing protein n=1 Tax=Tessaracoccus bendigoensis DSM 12906 TaxID=1123357 RepID=A0A1M6KAA5_9ACTN|nr:PH domain-containing protein [Tessaracoccus bendigoensis DSM 12906]